MVEVKVVTVLSSLLSLPQSYLFHLLGGGITCLTLLQGCVHPCRLEEILEQEIVLCLFTYLFGFIFVSFL